ncbi:3-carboxymuconate cyclase [Podospora conica]|nr:3-carboxymuconate cyclase [Schizothecium conicum]
MPSLASLAAVALLGVLPAITALPSVAPRQSRLRNARALYFLTNNEDNAVIAAELGPDGLLTGRASSSLTGGLGGSGIDAATNQPAAPDSLFSQSALTVLDDLLLLVNPGSNTLTSFHIPRTGSPLTLTPLQTPLALPGSFPVTVAASRRHSLVCVGATGSLAGVTCARVDATTRMLSRFDTLRPFAAPLNQTDPPRGPGGTVSHVLFDDEEARLLVTVKGVPGTEGRNGFVAAYDVVDGVVAREPAWTTSPEGTGVLFGAAGIPGSGGEVVVTDAGFGAVVLGRDGGVKGGVRAEVEGQVATCWVAVSAVTGTAWVTDVGRNRLVEVDVRGEDGARVLGVIDLSQGSNNTGLVDLATTGDLVYMLSPGDNKAGSTPAVSVVNVRTREMVQHVEVAAVGADGSAMGMTLMF